ncbi:MAG: ribosome recycling factor [Gammaproteobacteria bacterium]|nr:ribosome recycling factor [Gammaproteobacteria bacterium]
MIDEIKDDASTRMGKTLNSLHAAFARIRTGRANPALLDTVMIEYFGTSVPVKQVASITVEEGRTLVISPWEKSTLVEIERSIQRSDLGLTPTSNGEVIRLPLPPLTEENRRDLIRHARLEAEQARVAVRNIRRDAIHDVRELLKERLATEDEAHQAERDLQTITDDKVNSIDEELAGKEKDLLEF